MTAHDKSTADVLNELSVDKAQGLSTAEVAARKEKYGENRLQEKKKELADQVLGGEGVGSGSFTREELKEIIGIL